MTKLERIMWALLNGYDLHMVGTPKGVIIGSLLSLHQPKGYAECMRSEVAFALLEQGLTSVFPELSHEEDTDGYRKAAWMQTCARLDAWLGGRRTFRAWSNGSCITARLFGVQEVQTPQEIMDMVIQTGEKETWSCGRGYVYSTTPDPDWPMPGSITTTIVRRPKGRDASRDWAYPILKSGAGPDLLRALTVALDAYEEEVIL